MMGEKLRVISINFPFENQEVVHVNTLATERAFFDFDVVVIRPQKFSHSREYDIYQNLELMMNTKRIELNRLFAQGGVLVVILDVPDTYSVLTGGYSGGTRYSVNNYSFLQDKFANCLRRGTGEQISYSDPAEPFVAVLKKSTVAWTAYFASTPDHPFNDLKFFASVGSGTAVAGKMPFAEGHLIFLPNLRQLDEPLFFDACADYRYKRQGTKPPDWVNKVFLPGLAIIEADIAEIDKQISGLQVVRRKQQQQLEDRSMYRKLLYEKGKTQLEPIVRHALNDLGFRATPGEVIKGTNYEIDGRTAEGSTTGLIEVKGSKNQIALDEFSPFVVKILADHEASKVMSKGILVGNGLCETPPERRLGDAVFSSHVLDAAKRNSVALVNSTDLYWLCCTILDGGSVDKNAVRETILNGNGYVDLRPFCGKPPWPGTS